MAADSGEDLDLAKWSAVLDPLPYFDADRTCTKCGHDVIVTTYEPNTSHYGCPIAKALSTSYGPEHMSRCCQRCHFKWEERVIG